NSRVMKWGALEPGRLPPVPVRLPPHIPLAMVLTPTRLLRCRSLRSCAQDHPLALRQCANKLADPLRRFEPATGQNNYSGFRRSDNASVEELVECCRAAS